MLGGIAQVSGRRQGCSGGEGAGIRGLTEHACQVSSPAARSIEPTDVFVAESFVDHPPGRYSSRSPSGGCARSHEVQIHDADDDLLVLGQATADEVLDRLPISLVDLGHVVDHFFHALNLHHFPYAATRSAPVICALHRQTVRTLQANGLYW